MESKKMKKVTLETLVAGAVKKGIQEARKGAPKTFKISRKQLAEGVRKGLLKALKENAMSMPSEAGMPPTTPAPAAPNAGKIPTPEALQEMLNAGDGLEMNLVGEDSQVFDAALQEAGLNHHKAFGMMQTGKGLHEVLTALVTYAENKKNIKAAELAENLIHVLA